MYHKSISKDVWRLKKGAEITLVQGDTLLKLEVRHDYGDDLISARPVGSDKQSNRFYDLRKIEVRESNEHT